MPRPIDAFEYERRLIFSKDVHDKVDEDGLYAVIDVLDAMPTMWLMDEESHRSLTFPKEKGTSMRHWRWDKDIIYRQNAIELARQYCPDDDGTCSKADEDMRNLLDELENLPSAVVEAEPKQAYVIVDEDGNMECSNCGSSFCFDNYCGHCGAKLIGKRKGEVEEAD